MIRLTTRLATAALLLSACDIEHKCDVVYGMADSAMCSADVSRAIERPMSGLGFDGFPGGTATGTITGVGDGTLAIDVGGETINFHWHGAWPFPIAVGQEALVESLGERQSVRVGERTLAVLTPVYREAPTLSYALGSRLCIDQLLGCADPTGHRGLTMRVRTPLLQGEIEPGETKQVGSWKVSNLGARSTSPSLCGEEEEPVTVAGQLIAWTVDESEVEGPRCSAEVRSAVESFQGSYGVTGAIPDGPVVGTVTSIQNPVHIETENGTVFFRWPGVLPEGLKAGHTVEVTSFDHQATLKTDTHVLWVLDTGGMTAGEIYTGNIPDGPIVRSDAGCTVSDSLESIDAVVLWDAGSIGLAPGEEVDAGPWKVKHHTGWFSPVFDCGMSYDSGIRMVTSAIKRLED